VAGAKQVLLFHHDPRRTDDELDEIMQGVTNSGIVVEAAAEGRVLELGGNSREDS
jgi:hypothetical protein